MFKKTLLGAVILMVVLVSGLSAAPTLYEGNGYKILDLPHYYEFDTSENPTKYYWCGHGAFKMAIEPAGIYKGLDDIHEDFKVANIGLGGYDATKTSECFTGYCAFPNLMKKAISTYSSQGFNISYSRTTIYNHSSFLSKVKQEIDNGNSLIVLSSKVWSYSNNNWINYGHYMNIIGYVDKSDGRTLIVLRDTYKEISNSFYDGAFYSEYFWDMTKGKGDNGGMPLIIIKD